MSAASKLRLASSGPGATPGFGGVTFTKLPVPGKTFDSSGAGPGGVAAGAAGGATAAACLSASSLRKPGGRREKAPSTMGMRAAVAGIFKGFIVRSLVRLRLLLAPGASPGEEFFRGQG